MTPGSVVIPRLEPRLALRGDVDGRAGRGCVAHIATPPAPPRRILDVEADVLVVDGQLAPPPRAEGWMVRHRGPGARRQSGQLDRRHDREGDRDDPAAERDGTTRSTAATTESTSSTETDDQPTSSHGTPPRAVTGAVTRPVTPMVLRGGCPGRLKARCSEHRAFCCAPEGTRTPNLLIRSQMLYPLSYGRMAPQGRRRRYRPGARSPKP